MFVGIFCAAEEGAGSDPAGEEGEDENKGREGASCDEVVGLGFYFAQAAE